MNTVANNWRSSKVKYLARYINGYPFKPVNWSDRGRPIIRIQNLSNPDADPNYFEGVIPDVYLVKPGDLLLSWSATLGAYEWPGPDAWLNQHIFKVELDEKQVSKRYYRWLAHWFMSELGSEAHGSTMQHLTKDRFGSFNVQLPPPSLQETISSYLDRETARIDGLIAEKERMLALLEEKRAALISRVVTRGLDPNAPLKPSGQKWLGEIPTHWKLVRLKFLLLDIEQGWSPQCDNHPADPDEWGVLKVGAVNDWIFNPSENKRLPDEIDPLHQYEIKRHDLLMSRANTSQLLGSIVYVDEVSSKLLLCDKLYRLSVKNNELDREFLVAFLRATPGRFQLEREASGTSGSMQNIGQDTVQNLWVAIPPLDEQQRISREIADFRKESEKIDAWLRKTIDLLKERRSALITAAVTGQIPLEDMTP